MLSVGLTNLLSLTHLVVLGPLVFYLCRELHLRHLEPFSPAGVWAIVASATAIVSLVFDLRDFGRWILGERGIVHPGPDLSVPWGWLGAIALTPALAGRYAFRPPAAARTAG